MMCSLGSARSLGRREARARLLKIGVLAGVFCLLPLLGPAPDRLKTAGAAPEIGSLTGQLLVATPDMPDPRFARTVLYMLRHDAAGAMGLVLNRPVGDLPVARLLEQLGLENKGVQGTVRVHYGGPVAGLQGFVLHTPDYQGNGTRIVADGVALTSQSEILRDISTGGGPRRFLLAFGYAGWASGQLEAEMKAGHWVAVPADEALLFDDDYQGKWDRAWARQLIRL